MNRSIPRVRRNPDHISSHSNRSESESNGQSTGATDASSRSLRVVRPALVTTSSSAPSPVASTATPSRSSLSTPSTLPPSTASPPESSLDALTKLVQKLAKKVDSLSSEIASLSKSNKTAKTHEELERLYAQHQHAFLHATKSFIVTMVPETLQNVTKMRKSTVDAFRSTMRAELPDECTPEQERFLMNKIFTHFRKTLSNIKIAFNKCCAELSREELTEKQISDHAVLFWQRHLFRNSPSDALVSKLAREISRRLQNDAAPPSKRRRVVTDDASGAEEEDGDQQDALTDVDATQEETSSTGNDADLEATQEDAIAVEDIDDEH